MAKYLVLDFITRSVNYGLDEQTSLKGIFDDKDTATNFGKELIRMKMADGNPGVVVDCVKEHAIAKRFGVKLDETTTFWCSVDSNEVGAYIENKRGTNIMHTIRVEEYDEGSTLSLHWSFYDV